MKPQRKSPLTLTRETGLEKQSRENYTAHRVSLRAAVNAKCRDCIYDPQSGLGNWRQQVTACTCARCPLFSVRPISGARTPSKPPNNSSGGFKAPEQGKDGL